VESEKWESRGSSKRPLGEGVFGPLLHTGKLVTKRPLLPGNRAEILHNGEEAYPAMLKAIGDARESVYLCTYIFDSDRTGRVFTEALSAAVQRGVRVRVLIDAFGQYYSYPPAARLLRKAGVPVATFLPLSFSPNRFHPNLRNHRKQLLIDRETVFMGGMNIGDRHLIRQNGGKRKVADIHFKVEGPVAEEFRGIFLADWFFATRESLPWRRQKPRARTGGISCRVISGGPNEDFEKLNWILLAALAVSRKRVQIMTPYFVPDRIMIAALNSVALRGVEVEVILPEKNNLPFVGWAGRALLWEMLEKGIRFYSQPLPFCHGKFFIVDEAYALIGSSNWDSRSFRLNFELDMEVYDKGFCEKLSKYFDVTREKSKEVTLGKLDREPLSSRFRNSMMKLFSPYL
jgi:cardiolipin synthase